MKSVIYYNETQREAIEYTSRLIDFGVALSVYAALNELRNAIYVLMQSRFFKHTVKARSKNTLEMCDRKIKELKTLVKHGDFAETYWDAVVDASESDIENFYSELKATINEAGISDSDFYGKMETARVLLEAACIHYQEVIKDSTNKYMTKNMEDMKNCNLFNIFHEFYVLNISKEWNAICYELYKKKNKDVVLTNKRTESAFQIIADKFAKGLYIDECLKATKEDFPDFSDLKIIVEN